MHRGPRPKCLRLVGDGTSRANYPNHFIRSDHLIAMYFHHMISDQSIDDPSGGNRSITTYSEHSASEVQRFWRQRLPGKLAIASRNPGLVAWCLLSAFIGTGTLIRIPQLHHSLFENSQPAAGFAFRQTQTAFVIQKYAADGINPLSTPLPVFGRNSNVPLEFPLFQSLGALLMHTGLPSDAAARLLALVSFQASGLFLALILFRWHGRMVALAAVALFEFLPLGLSWGAASLIDFFAVALALAMVCFLDQWFRGGSILTLLAGSLAAVLAFLVKPTTAPSWSLLLIASAAMVINRTGWRIQWKRLLLGFAIGPGTGVVAAGIWTSYADSVKASNPLTRFLTSIALRGWNFGTLAQRVDPHVYVAILNKVMVHIAGPGMVGLWLGIGAAIVLPRSTQRLAIWGWLLAAISAPLIFLNLYSIHTYYLIAVYPALVTVMAIGLVWAARFLPRRNSRRVITAGVVATLVATFSSAGARSDFSELIDGGSVPKASIEIREFTPANSSIIMIGCDWDPTIMYFAQREGVMFRDPSSGDFWHIEKIADYHFLYSCSSGLKPAQWLPPGYTAVPQGVPGLYRVIAKT